MGQETWWEHFLCYFYVLCLGTKFGPTLYLGRDSAFTYHPWECQWSFGSFGSRGARRVTPNSCWWRTAEVLPGVMDHIRYPPTAAWFVSLTVCCKRKGLRSFNIWADPSLWRAGVDHPGFTVVDGHQIWIHQPLPTNNRDHHYYLQDLGFGIACVDQVYCLCAP